MKKNGNGYNIYCSQLGKKYNLSYFKNIYSEFENKLKSEYFNDAGFLVIRDDSNYMIANIKSHGNFIDSKTQSVHTHSDLFSFELFINEKSFIIDPGTFVYTSNYSLRNLYRSTMMHNTASIDNKSQEEINEKNLFQMTNYSNPSLEAFKENKHEIFFSAKHEGYKRLKNPVIHQRSINYYKKNKEWVILDSFDGNGNNVIELAYHFSDKVILELKNKNSFITKSTGTNIEISFSSKSDFKVLKSNYSLSKSYGTLNKAEKLVIRFDGKLPYSLETIIRKI
tara:strand:- start:1370 stop:2212 length:843 start_codon:yes stop_codon:yes gene_type:complete